jgi:hypothetical protein
MTKTVDYSWTYVGAPTIADAGYIGSERYLGTDGRCLTASERDELLAEGLGIGLIWETAADRSLDGYNAGFNDAVSANDYAERLGAPVVSIWYATDFHASQSQIEGPIADYYRGVRDYGGRQPRVYGGAPVIDFCVAHIAGFGPGWQAAAASWSNYVLSPNACLLQEVAQIWNGAADTNVVLCADDAIDWLWGRSGGDWLSMATKDEVAEVVRTEINKALTLMYTGSRLLRVPPDGRVFEVVMVDGRRFKRHITTPDECESLQWVDQVAGSPGDAPREITNPDYVAVFDAMPWL